MLVGMTAAATTDCRNDGVPGWPAAGTTGSCLGGAPVRRWRDAYSVEDLLLS